MKKSKAISSIVVIVISIIFIVIIARVLLSTSGSINQGSFRVNDLVINSSLDVEEVNSDQENSGGFDTMKLNLSQRNNISLLIQKNSEIKEIYIDNIKFTHPTKKGNLILYQNGAKDDAISTFDQKIIVYPEEKEDQILINLNIDNVEFLTDAKIPDGTNAITFDGTMLNLVGVNLSDLQMNIKFNVYIVELSGKINVCKFDFKFPEEELTNSGISIKRQNTSYYNFVIEDNFIKKWLNRL